MQTEHDAKLTGRIPRWIVLKEGLVGRSALLARAVTRDTPLGLGLCEHYR
jgi:hypothetical protein